MHEACFAESPTLVREIDHKGRRIRVSVWYAVNTIPKDTGFDSIPSVSLDSRVRGFPVIKATVESTGVGYANNFGWIQVVSHLDSSGNVEDWSPDPFPMLRDRGVPFATLGYLPSFFDAPFWPDRPRIHWRADLFLSPIVVRRPSEEDILPLAGFRWGFRIPEEGRDPILLPLETVGKAAWEDSLPNLRFWYPSWRFGDWKA